jgi:amidase
MARYVEDLALCLPVIAGVDWNDPAIVPMPFGDSGAVEFDRLKVAVFSSNGIATPTTETIRAVADAAGVLSDAGMRVEEARPEAAGETHALSERLWRTYLPPWSQKLLLKAGTIDASEMSGAGQMISAASLADLSEDMGDFRSSMLSFMQAYDAIVCPVNAYPALPHGSWNDNMPAFSYTITFSLTGWPVVVVRAGTSPEGLPIGVQIAARPWNEHLALALAQLVEQAMRGWRKPPL